jgi:hypothetical protein
LITLLPGSANLRLVTDEQLKVGCGMHREAARLQLERGLRKLEARQNISSSEEKAMMCLANHFIWRPAFSNRVATGVDVRARTNLTILGARGKRLTYRTTRGNRVAHAVQA